MGMVALRLGAGVAAAHLRIGVLGATWDLNEPHRGFQPTDGATNTWSGRIFVPNCFLLRLPVAQHFT